MWVCVFVVGFAHILFLIIYVYFFVELIIWFDLVFFSFRQIFTYKFIGRNMFTFARTRIYAYFMTEICSKIFNIEDSSRMRYSYVIFASFTRLIKCFFFIFPLRTVCMCFRLFCWFFFHLFFVLHRLDDLVFGISVVSIRARVIWNKWVCVKNVHLFMANINW